MFVLNVIGKGAEPDLFAGLGASAVEILSAGFAFDIPVADHAVLAMARALMPVKTTSAHWLAHPAFADAVEQFLRREGQGIGDYLEHLERRSPFRQGSAP